MYLVRLKFIVGLLMVVVVVGFAVPD
jgi:hypothetical protein